MWVIKKDNKFISYLIILISLFILFLITLEQYKQLQHNLDKRNELNSSIKQKREQILKNDKIKEKIQKNSQTTEKFLLEIKEDELIDYIYSYVENTDSEESRIEIKSINISEWKKNELWFNETNINISAVVSNENTMKRFVDFFNSSDSKYNFYIDNFTYPNDGRSGSYKIDIPLKILYK